MPPVQYDFNGLANALNNFTGTMTGILDRQAKEQARADLLNMQANFELESNRFLNELKASNNYDNWEQKYNDFITKQSDLMQRNSRNQYTAKAAREMLMGYSVNMRKNIENQVFGMRNNDILQKNQDTDNLIDQLYNGQENIDRHATIADREVLNGLITPENYEYKLQNYAVNALNSHYVEVMQNEIQNAIASGKGEQAVLDAIDNDKFTPILKAVNWSATNIDDYDEGKAQYTDISHSVNIKAVKENAKKIAKQQYQAQLKDMQQKNANDLSQFYTNIWQPGNSATMQLHLCKQGLSMLKNTYTGNKISEDDRIRYTNMFKNMEEALTKDESKGGSGTGGSSAKTESFAAFIKGLPEVALMHIANGELLNSYEAKNAIQQVIEDTYFSKEWNETDGLTAAEKKQYFANNYSNFGNTVLSNEFIKKRLDHEPKFATINARYEEVIKDIGKNHDKYTQDAATYLTEFVYDLVASTGQEVTPEQIKALESNINAVTLTKADKLISGFTLETRLSKAEENDVVFTDRNGQEHVAAGAKESLEKLSNDIIAKMRKDKGIELSFKGFEKIPNDATSVPHFVDKDGKEYKARTIRNEKGKAIGIELVDMDGNVIEGTKGKEKTEKQRTKQALKEAKKEVNKYELYKPESIIYGE